MILFTPSPGTSMNVIYRQLCSILCVSVCVSVCECLCVCVCVCVCVRETEREGGVKSTLSFFPSVFVWVKESQSKTHVQNRSARALRETLCVCVCVCVTSNHVSSQLSLH